MKIIDFSRFFGFRMAPSWLKWGKMDHICAKLALGWPKLTQVDPSWLQVRSSMPQVGSKLASSWSKLVPRRLKTGPDAAMHCRFSVHSGFSILNKIGRAHV